MTAATGISTYEIERNKPLPDPLHGLVQANIIYALGSYRKDYQIMSEVTLDTNPKTTPDVIIAQKKKLIFDEVAAKMKEAPLIAVEIQSPSQSIAALQRKTRKQYFPMGIQSVWIVNPALKGVQVL